MTGRARVTVDRGPFEMVPHWIIDHPELSANAIRLYLLMRRHGNDRGVCFPGRKRLAEQMGTSPSTVDRARAELVAVGAICETQRKAQDGDWTSNLYHVHWDRAEACDRLTSDDTSPAGEYTPPAGDETGLPQVMNEPRPTKNLDPLTEMPGSTEPAERTEGQRVNTITRAYTDRVPLSNFPAVAGIVRKAVRAGLWPDEEIADALARLGDEGRAVTTDSLRYELQGFAGPRSNRERQLRDGIALARDLAAPDPWAPRELEAGER